MKHAQSKDVQQIKFVSASRDLEITMTRSWSEDYIRQGSSDKALRAQDASVRGAYLWV